MSEVISSKAEINTGMTMVELKGKVVNDLTVLSSDKEREYAVETLAKFILDVGRPRLIMLLSHELRYFTTFEIKKADLKQAANEIVYFLESEEFFKDLGGLKLIEIEKDHVEIWIGDKFFALFNYDGYIVEV